MTLLDHIGVEIMRFSAMMPRYPTERMDLKQMTINCMWKMDSIQIGEPLSEKPLLHAVKWFGEQPGMVTPPYIAGARIFRDEDDTERLVIMLSAEFAP